LATELGLECDLHVYLGEHTAALVLQRLDHRKEDIIEFAWRLRAGTVQLRKNIP